MLTAKSRLLGGLDLTPADILDRGRGSAFERGLELGHPKADEDLPAVGQSKELQPLPMTQQLIDAGGVERARQIA